ncbi:MAG: glycosyltransferase family 2 protein [Patescibacteria group bacterium]
MKLSVHLVSWNGAKYIAPLFDSLRRQTFKDWKLRIWDNDSGDGTVEEIKKELANFPFEHEMIENDENIGFAGGHNSLIKNYELRITNYVLLLNQDLYLEADCLKKMVKFLDSHDDVAVISPRLMKWDFNRHSGRSEESLASGEFTDVIDSLGLKVFRNRRVVEQYAGNEWNDKLRNQLTKGIASSPPASRNDAYLPVFGVSGTMPMLRTAAIEQIKFSNGNFLDETYHSYKEDVDLAYRLNSAGFNSATLLDAVAYHDRSAAGPGALSDAAALANKKKQSDRIKYHSYKNQLMTIYKNEYWQNFALDFWPILWYELKKFGYFLIFDRAVLKGLKEIWLNRKGLKLRRIQIKNKQKIDWKEMRKRLGV